MIDKPNYTQIPNIILDDFIMCMGASEFKVVMAISRQTFGYHRERHKMSISMLQGLTGLSRQGVINGVAAGIERGVIDREADGDGFTYALNIADSASQKNGLPLVNVVDQASQKNRLEVVNDVDLYTPALKKELKKELKKVKRKREAAPPARPKLPSRGGSTKRTFESPHVNNGKFDPATGYIRRDIGTTAIEIYYERFDVQNDTARLNPIKEDDLARHCTDLDRLREVVTAYSQTSYRVGNVKLILDWYRDGVPEKHRAPSGQTKGMTSLQRLAESNGVKL